MYKFCVTRTRFGSPKAIFREYNNYTSTANSTKWFEPFVEMYLYFSLKTAPSKAATFRCDVVFLKQLITVNVCINLLF